MARSKFFQSIIFARSIACTIPLVSSEQGCKVPLQSIKLKEANVSIGRYDAPDTIFLTLKRTTLDEPCVEPETRSATFSGIEMVGHPEEPERPSPTETSPIPRTLDPCGLGASWTLDVPDDLDRNVDSAVIQIADTLNERPVITIEVPQPFETYSLNWGRPADGRVRLKERVHLEYSPTSALARVSLRFDSTTIWLMPDLGYYSNGFIAFYVPSETPVGVGNVEVLFNRDNEKVVCAGAPRCTVTYLSAWRTVPVEVLP